jgi:hypothetical protein
MNQPGYSAVHMNQPGYPACLPSQMRLRARLGDLLVSAGPRHFNSDLRNAGAQRVDVATSADASSPTKDADASSPTKEGAPPGWKGRRRKL